MAFDIFFGKRSSPLKKSVPIDNMFYLCMTITGVLINLRKSLANRIKKNWLKLKVGSMQVFRNRSSDGRHDRSICKKNKICYSRHHFFRSIIILIVLFVITLTAAWMNRYIRTQTAHFIQ
jgi:hypothetical protein